MTSERLPLFKAYDLRGRQPDELNAAIAWHVGRALAEVLPDAKTAVLGMDSRLTSPELLRALAAGLASRGVACQSLGLCGTEEVYHAAGSGACDVGLMVTASHNPVEYNGVKPVTKGGLPLTPEVFAAWETATRASLTSGLAAPITFPEVPTLNLRPAYVQHMLECINPASIPAQTIVINAGNGAAGPTADALLAHLPQLKVVRVHHEADGTFPHGIPNPLLPGNRASTAEAVVQHGASLGIAWDGDFDRCFFYTGEGKFVSNYHIAALLAEAMQQKFPGSVLVQDVRLNWATEAVVRKAGGQVVTSKVGHGYFKPLMRQNGSPFAGEISGHFYFRDFFYCDSGMLPWLVLLELLGQRRQTLAEAVAELERTYPASDETNYVTPTPAKAFLAEVQSALRALAPEHDTLDGLTLTDVASGWRANIRASSNEPLLRLNVEATCPDVLRARFEALHSLLVQHGATPAGDH